MIWRAQSRMWKGLYALNDAGTGMIRVRSLLSLSFPKPLVPKLNLGTSATSA